MRAVFTEIDGVRTRYLHGGEGYPVLLLHGVGVSADSWFRTVDPLAASFRVAAPDLLDSGFTAAGPYRGGPPYPYMIDHLAGFVDALGMKRFAVVGSSFGSVLAGLLYLRMPQRVERLVMVGCGPAFNTPEELVRVYEASYANGRAALLDPTYAACRRRMENLVHDPARVPAELLLVQMTISALPDALEAYERRMNGIRGIDALRTYGIEHRLAEIAAPTLVIWGRQDPRGSYAQAVEAVGRLPRGRMIVYEQCGHFPHLEHPAAFNRDVASFLGET